MKIFQETEEMLGSTELTTQGERWKNGVTQHHWPQGARLLDSSIQPFDVQIWYLVLLQLPVFAWAFWGHHNLMYHPDQLRVWAPLALGTPTLQLPQRPTKILRYKPCWSFNPARTSWYGTCFIHGVLTVACGSPNCVNITQLGQDSPIKNWKRF